MSEKVYFGVAPLPKGHRHPTMKESVDNSQVRYYGLHKIDNRLITAKAKKPNQQKNRDKLGLELIKLRGRVKNLTSKANLEKDPVKKAEFASLLGKAKADLDKVKQLFSEADKGKVAKVAKVTKVDKDINIPFVDPSVYDQVAEDLYNRTELQKDQVKGLIKSMTKLKKIPIKKHSDLSEIEQAVETMKENINDLKTEYNHLQKSFKQFQKNPSDEEARALITFISKIIQDCKNIGHQASTSQSHEEMIAKQGLYEQVIQIYNNVMVIQKKIREQYDISGVSSAQSKLIDKFDKEIDDKLKVYNDLLDSFKTYYKNPKGKEKKIKALNKEALDLANQCMKIAKDSWNVIEDIDLKKRVYSKAHKLYTIAMDLLPQVSDEEEPPTKAKTPVKAKAPVKAKTPIKAKTLVTVKNPLTEALNKLKEQEKELTKDVKKLKNNSNYRLSDAKEIQHDIKKFVKEYQGLEKKIKKLPNNKKLLADIAYLDDKVDDMDLILEEFFDEHEDGDDDDDY